MDFTPIFINAMFVLLIGVYVYKNERRIADISTRHDGTGVTYIRWGKKLCDGSNTETIYSGQVGGGHYAHTGASVNYVCLPNDPDVAQPLKPHCDYDLIYGAEYQIGAYNQPQGMRSGIENRDAACAACLAKGKTASIIIPGRETCYKGWTKEYSGILMAGKYDHSASSEYACVDNDAEAISGDSKDENGILFYPVKTVCGSLKCPPYKQDTEVLCVVCSK
ncbi:short-chain collagen C4-like isoform X2 [Mytilus californianus]|uniref:short-chain collagen C4-like isoform X2 n=1 Tax=Mytilus californianus TaxID=6549 RepID=UPI002245B0FB|nr:short-chain collagen C4-like isoform X2 [Mytilus californianus]